MRVAVCSSQSYDRHYFLEANHDNGHDLVFFDSHLCEETRHMVTGFPAVCVFVNDTLNNTVLQILAAQKTSLIAIRGAGFNHVDIRSAAELGLHVVRVPAYSPHSVAEHSVALILSLNRHLHHAYNRVRSGNFSLPGLLGFEMRGKTVSIIGTGRIGSVVAKILHGFDCHLIAYDPQQNSTCINLGVEYVSLKKLYASSDIITLHCPLNRKTRHMIDTLAVINGLKSCKISYLGLDVYEQEGDLFFQDLSNQVIQDDMFERPLTFPNVLVSGHKGFFTDEALSSIAKTTLQNISLFEKDGVCQNEVTMEFIQ